MSSESRRERRAITPVSIFGAGHLTRTLLPLLPAAGYRPLAVCDLHIATARSACRLLSREAPRPTTRPAEALQDAELILLAVPDREIQPLARRLASLSGVRWKDRVALHHAGSAGPKLLAPLAKRGAGAGVLHPLQCLGDPALARDLIAGSRARVEGDRRGKAAAMRLAKALGLVPLRFAAGTSEARRAAYHAAASVVSNDLIALLALGLDLMEKAGVARRSAREGLVALARGTLLQAGHGGLERALTGPVARGDIGTLEAQMKRLKDIPGGEEVHRLLSLRLARIARAKGDREAATRVERSLGAVSGRRGSRTL